MSSITFGALLNVYNEELLLPYCLEGLMSDIDQCIIINGSANGPSKDKSKKVIDSYLSLYPNKIKYFEGAFTNPDGSWDESEQVNLGFSKIETDFVIRIHADIVFDYGEIAKIKSILSRFSHKKFIYSFQRDFWVDTDHILLYNFPLEVQLPHPIANDPIAIAMSAKPRAIDNENGKFGVVANIDWQNDILWLPDIKKYHFGFVKPFKLMLEKVYISMRKGDCFPLDGVTDEQINEKAYAHVEAMMNAPCYDYAGEYPQVAEPIRHISMRDGYKES
jgi:hypothetical protein